MEATDTENDDRWREVSRRAATTLGRVERNDPTLRAVKVSGRFNAELDSYPESAREGFFWYESGADLARFGAGVGANTNLGSLFVDAGSLGTAAADNAAFFEGLRRNHSITLLMLHRLDLSVGLGRGLFNNFVGNNGVLETIAVDRFYLGDGGIGVFLSAISSCPSLKHGCLTRCNIDDGILDEFVSGVRRGWQVLSRLNLSGNSFGGVGCDKLSTLLQDPDCNLEVIDLSHNNRIDDACARSLANSLKVNCTLQYLGLDDTAITVDGWEAFSDVLCNRASVNDTYHSNHDLVSLGNGRGGRVLPDYVSSLLGMNRWDDKKRVRTEKILLHHPNLEMEPFFEWGLKMLPTVASWFDGARDYGHISAKKLSAIYKFVRAFPDAIEASMTGGVKRKISEIN